MKNGTMKKALLRLSIIGACIFGLSSTAMAQTWCQDLGHSIFGPAPAQYSCNPPNWNSWSYAPSIGHGNGPLSSFEAAIADMQSRLQEIYGWRQQPCSFSLGGFTAYSGNNDHWQVFNGTLTVTGCGNTYPETSTPYVVGGRTATCPVGGYLTSGPAPDYATLCVSKVSTTLKKVVLDPGHGLNCAAIGQRLGAIGYTDFPINDPPAGRLREDNLTVAIALETERQLRGKYNVIMTKRDVYSCPTLAERRRIASEANAKAFVSIHINSAYTTVAGVNVPLIGGIFSGSSGIYHQNAPYAQPLAAQIASSVSSSIGVNNRGTMTANVAVVRPYIGINMPAVLLETARLIGTDERILHVPGSTSVAASGICTALDAIIGNQ